MIDPEEIRFLRELRNTGITGAQALGAIRERRVANAMGLAPNAVSGPGVITETAPVPLPPTANALLGRQNLTAGGAPLTTGNEIPIQQNQGGIFSRLGQAIGALTPEQIMQISQFAGSGAGGKFTIPAALGLAVTSGRQNLTDDAETTSAIRSIQSDLADEKDSDKLKQGELIIRLMKAKRFQNDPETQRLYIRKLLDLYEPKVKDPVLESLKQEFLKAKTEQAKAGAEKLSAQAEQVGVEPEKSEKVGFREKQARRKALTLLKENRIKPTEENIQIIMAELEFPTKEDIGQTLPPLQRKLRELRDSNIKTPRPKGKGIEIGTVVIKSGRKFKVVGHDTDGEPLVEEVR